MAIKIFTKNNYIFLFDDDTTKSIDGKIKDSYFLRTNNTPEEYLFINPLGRTKYVLRSEIQKQNGSPYAGFEWEDFYTGLAEQQGVVIDDSTPINVNVTNQLDLTTITSHLLNIKNSVANIDTNTDAVESKIDSVVSAINSNGTVNHSDLLSIITQLQAVNANTDTLESLAGSILAKIIASPSTLSEQQAQTTQLQNINTKLANPLSVTVTNPTDLTTVTAYLLSIKNDMTAVNANTDQIEAKIDSVVSAINSNGSINHTDLSNILTQLQAVNANTDGQEALLTSILAKIISSPATLAEQQTQTAKLASIDSKLTSPLSVTVTNQIDLTTVTSHLLAIKNSVANIDTNTDTVEQKITDTITAINSNGSVNHSDLVSILTQLQAVNANTDTLESLASSILAKIIASPSTLAEQQTQTTKLTSIQANQTNGNQLVQPLHIVEDTYTPVDGGIELLRTLPRLDPSFNTKIRGSILTDEGSFRDDFSSALGVDYVFTATGNGSTNQSTTFQNILMGTNVGSTSLIILLDYSPIIVRGRLSFSQRIANQTIQFGLRDNVNTPNIASEFQLTGTSNTSINVFSQSSVTSGNSETYTQTIPNAKTTAVALDYEIQVSVDEVSFFIDDILVRTCKLHIPTTGTGSELYFFIKGTNTAVVTQTTVSIDYLNVANMNTIEVKNDFSSRPISVQQFGDQHHITGQLTTTATTADQNIISFVVPSNKTCFIIGYSIETANIGATAMKIGRGTLTAPTAGGEIDGQIFAQFKMNDTSNTLDSFRNVDSGSFPRRLGSSGDTIRVAVTPRTNASTLWTATLFYILR